ncbi:chemotaxis protein CheW [Kineosporia babensis]|uniref:Chemotaxis protein CheW n=1 Tax=Kineosporia babensis TaxID=499548 RepID=A0A9X1NBN6_9ACTN|nr:chemotaxis protein CheW [Kineosporia babensis]MCD5310326.1 chemotaxis protein CheW [Kineosporia babensis]
MSPLGTLAALDELGTRAAAMRAEFDAAFAELPGGDETALDDVLLLTVGGEERAVLLSEVAAVTSGPSITAVPSRHPAMIGIFSSRGSVAAVWDLASLLGLPAQEPRWLLVPAAEPGVALTFRDFTGFRRTETASIGTGRTLPLADLVGTIREICAKTEN